MAHLQNLQQKTFWCNLLKPKNPKLFWEKTIGRRFVFFVLQKQTLSFVPNESSFFPEKKETFLEKTGERTQTS